MFEEPDGNFPNGVPNPILPENRRETSEAVINNQADFGVAWDGDFDRCFFFDEKGNFIEGYYVVGLLAEMLLDRNKSGNNSDNDNFPEDCIIHDQRLIWNTQDIAKNCNARPVQSRSGHSYIKEKMRSENAIYGGEMSAHHYFRDFGFCDSGMIPWLLVAQGLCMQGKPLSHLVQDRIEKYPCSGEINFKINADPNKILDRILTFYSKEAPLIDKTDGVSLEMADWRFNIRMSNTEPLMRLNAESRGDKELLKRKVQEIRNIISEFT
jgi:phosphomannomutase